MKRYIAVLELDDEDEILDASVTYLNCNNGTNYLVRESVEFKEENEEIKVGDEVEHIDTYDRVIVTHVSKNTPYIDIMWEDGSVGIRAPIEKFKKTGRHFTEIEELLKKMKED